VVTSKTGKIIMSNKGAEDFIRMNNEVFTVPIPAGANYKIVVSSLNGVGNGSFGDIFQLAY
jgi:hypothetical protein